MKKRKRDVPILFWVTEEEKSQIEERMKLAGTVNMSAYLRKLALDGYILHLDLPEIQEMVRLLRLSGNNINQIARRLHGTGRIYEEDIGYLSEKQAQIWEGVNTILTRLAQLK